MPYQILILSRNPHASAIGQIKREVEHQLRTWIRPPLHRTLVVWPKHVSALDMTQPTAGVFVGGAPNEAVDAAAREAVDRGVPISTLIGEHATPSDALPGLLLQNLATRQTPGWQERIAQQLTAAVGLGHRASTLFLSYCTDDGQPHARKLTAALERDKHQVFLDEKDIGLGMNLGERIELSICRSDLLIQLRTPLATTRPWVAEEAAIAARAGVEILVVTWPNVPPPPQYLDHVALTRSHLTARTQELSAATCRMLAAEAQVARARALALRHARLASGFSKTAARLNWSPTLDPLGRWVDVTRHGLGERWVFRTGVPGSREFRAAEAHRAPRSTIRLAVDGWAQPSGDDHLVWLGAHLPVDLVRWWG